MRIIYNGKVYKKFEEVKTIFKEIILKYSDYDPDDIEIRDIDMKRTCCLNHKIAYQSGNHDVFIFDHKPTEEEIEPLKYYYFFTRDLVPVPYTNRRKIVDMKMRKPSTEHGWICKAWENV